MINFLKIEKEQIKVCSFLFHSIFHKKNIRGIMNVAKFVICPRSSSG